MKVSRREFLKYCTGSAAALGLDLSVLGAMERALAAGGGPPIVWLNGANCTGCTVSLANLISSKSPVDLTDLLVNTLNLAYHANIMGAAGDLAVDALFEATAGPFILVVDGGIPTAFDGHACVLWSRNGREMTALNAVRALAPKAGKVLCVGTCASFGGIPAGKPNPAGIESVSAVTGLETINIAGCPVHPDWVVWTVARLLAGVEVRLDGNGRPGDLFVDSVHKQCPRRGTRPARSFGENGGCLKELGCKGPRVRADCPSRQWNNRTNWCIGANAVCLGCTEQGFPDKFSPFYKIHG